MRRQFLFGIYGLGMKIYLFGIYLAALRSKKARKWISGRKGWRQKQPPTLDRRPLWFHAASSGEFEQGRPIIEQLKKEIPNRPILVTFFSTSGYAAAQKFSDQYHIEYLPLDGAGNARDFIRRWKPAMAIFIKYEIWPFYLRTLLFENIPTLIVSSRWRPEQIYFSSWLAPLFLPLLQNLDHIFVQDQLSLDILRDHDINHISHSGDTRVDRVLAIRESAFSHPGMPQTKDGEQVLIVGSSWPADEQIIFQALQHPDCPHIDRIIIVPHELSEDHLSEIEQAAPYPMARSEGEGSPLDTRMILVNEMGVLAQLYRYASMAYVGGGFGDGIHNTLEAAVYGIPVLFGPKHHKFIEATDLIERGTARSVNRVEDLVVALNTFANKNRGKEVETSNKEYFETQRGASARIANYILSKLNTRT
jgi:3-deoxy-D-manno-octulosonic-acid transferase